MKDEIVVTAQGLTDLKEELNLRLTATREGIANDIETARKQGDLSENAAYKAAMEDKDFNETRISNLEKMIKKALVKGGDHKNNKVDFGETFKLTNKQTGSGVTYTLVGGTEASPADRKISLDSPIGAAVMGKKYGEEVTISLPAGELEFIVEKA